MKRKRFAVKVLAVLCAALAAFTVGCKKDEKGLEYDGEVITLGGATTNTFKMNGLPNIGHGQDGEMYGGYIFNFSNNGMCSVYNDEYEYLSRFRVDKSLVLNPHANSVQFGTLKYDPSDEFPLLYVNIYNNYSKETDRKIGTCCVYRLTREGDNFSTKLVQVVKVGFAGTSERWPATFSTPYGNFNIDTDENKLYAYVMRGEGDNGTDTIFFKFDVPALSEGEYSDEYGCNVVTLSEDDIEDEFTTDFFRWIQGACYHGGKLYITEGFADDAVDKPMIRVVDLDKKQIVSVIDLYALGFPYEPELIAIYKGEMYLNFANNAEVTFYHVDFI